MPDRSARMRSVMVQKPNTPTSADVARLAGVSRATVSYVLNNTRSVRISEPTRRRVHEAARSWGTCRTPPPAACAPDTAVRSSCPPRRSRRAPSTARS
ncbi:hypothetical protein SGPA1_40974 [Streptomyces misionensis JCM 4497]